MEIISWVRALWQVAPGTSLTDLNPPLWANFVSVYFPHPQWGELSKNYCTDFRPEISDGEIWGFEVKTNIRDAVNLTFEGIKAVPSEYKVWLLDPMLQTSQNLNQMHVIHLLPQLNTPNGCNF